MTNFSELGLAEPFLRALAEKGYDAPTPIQEQAIPVVLRGDDLLGIAKTGTGKTAAFALPILQHLNEATAKTTGGKPANSGKLHILRALILTPTRELAIQIDENIVEYSKYTPLKSTVIFGGVKQGAQVERLKKGVDILTATPGRLLDLMGQGIVHLDTITHFVLDEADRMLDMGFVADIRRVVAALPKQRQTLFFSATMPDPIVKLSRSMLSAHPVRVEVTPQCTAVESVDQKIYIVEKPDKKALLSEILKNESTQTLVFSRTKHGADNIARTLKKAGVHAAAIHGDKSQGARQTALRDFKEGKLPVLVATDIAARGLDIKELPLVVNFDLPDVVETYVHRIGRTGRAGATGRAITFAEPDNEMLIQVRKIVGKNIPTQTYNKK